MTDNPIEEPAETDEWGELWVLFAQEGGEALDSVEETLLILEADPNDRDAVARLFRAMHTFKGNSRLMGLTTVETLAHHAEDLIALVRDHGRHFSSDMADLLLRALDQLRLLLEQTVAQRADVEPSAEIQSLIQALETLHADSHNAPVDTAEPVDALFSAAQSAPAAEESQAEHTAAESVPPAAEEPSAEDVIAQIDPQTDPLYIQIFLEISADEIPRICNALAMWEKTPEQAQATLLESVETLHHAASQMNYTEVVAALDQLIQAGGEAGAQRAATDTLYTALSQIQETYALLAPQAKSPDRFGLLQRSPSTTATATQAEQPSAREDDGTAEGNQQAYSDVNLGNFTQTVGEMLAAQATLHRVVERLTEFDLLSLIDRLMKQNDNNWYQARKELQGALKDWNNDLWNLTQLETELAATLDRLQESALSLRVEAVMSILLPLEPLVKSLAHRRGSEIELRIQGRDVEMDRHLLSRLSGPIRRVVRFMAAESVEPREERVQSGKPPHGTISITASKTEDRVHITIEDDGRGLHEATILERARSLGWLNGHQPTASELGRWMVDQRFGTIAASPGRAGVDFGSIHAEMTVDRGQIHLVNQPGRGLKVDLEMPLDMAVIDGMVVRTGEIHYVAPIGMVRRIVKPTEQEIVHTSADGNHKMLRLDEQLVPIEYLSGDMAMGKPGERLMLVVEKNAQDVALVVDELIGQQQVLIRPLQGYLADIEGVSGCALLGDGDVGMVLRFN